MSGMKFGAHPMVVAVAMGLLGPAMLFEESDERATCSPVLDEEEAPDAEEFARVEHLWHEVRSLVQD